MYIYIYIYIYIYVQPILDVLDPNMQCKMGCVILIFEIWVQTFGRFWIFPPTVVFRFQWKMVENGPNFIKMSQMA